MKYLIPMLLFLAACGPKMVPVSTVTERSDTTIIKDRLVTIKVPSGSVDVNMDSLFESWTRVYGKAPVNRTIVMTDPKLRAQLTLFIDSLGNVYNAKCEALEGELTAKVQDKERIIREKDSQIVELKESFAQEIGNLIKGVIGGAIFLIVLGVVGWLVFRRMSS